MTVAAGVMIVAPCPVTGALTTLFLLRGPGSDHPMAWCFPGGCAEAGETTAEAAVRECLEECGLALEPADLGEPLTRGIAEAQVVTDDPATPPSESVDFTTYRHDVAAQFTPRLCEEHLGYCWAPVAHPPGPLHPGCGVALQRPTMDELGVARAMAAGQLVSPQRYENMTLWALRITATGAAYRRSIDEYVWRDPSIYLNDEFLARCNGLPAIWVHPPKATLDSDEFAKRVIGTVFLPYLKDDEVWAITKVYDDEANEGLANGQLSTSPTVVFRDPEVNERVTLEDGSTLLVEGKPSLLDHVAICEQGVWDKGGEPTGVDRSGITEPVVVGDAQRTAWPLVEMALTTARQDSLLGRFDQVLAQGRAHRPERVNRARGLARR